MVFEGIHSSIIHSNPEIMQKVISNRKSYSLNKEIEAMIRGAIWDRDMKVLEIVLKLDKLEPKLEPLMNDVIKIVKNEKLIEAAEKGDVKTVKELLTAGDIDLNADRGTRYDRVRTALMGAIEAENLEIIRLLLEAGAKVNSVKDFSGQPVSVVQMAVEKGNLGVLAQILKAETGTEVRGQVVIDAINSQPLNLKIIQMLIPKISVIYGGSNMYGMLDAAIKRKSSEVVEMLLKSGIFLAEKGKKLLIDAIKAGDIKIEESLLIELGLKKAKPEAKLEAKPEAKLEAKPEAKLEAKPVKEGALQEFINFCRGAFSGSK